MEPILNFAQLTAHLKKLNHRKRIAVVCANDPGAGSGTICAGGAGLIGVAAVGAGDQAEGQSSGQAQCKYVEEVGREAQVERPAFVFRRLNGLPKPHEPARE